MYALSRATGAAGRRTSRACCAVTRAHHAISSSQRVAGAPLQLNSDAGRLMGCVQARCWLPGVSEVQGPFIVQQDRASKPYLQHHHTGGSLTGSGVGFRRLWTRPSGQLLRSTAVVFTPERQLPRSTPPNCAQQLSSSLTLKAAHHKQPIHQNKSKQSPYRTNHRAPSSHRHSGDTRDLPLRPFSDPPLR